MNLYRERNHWNPECVAAPRNQKILPFLHFPRTLQPSELIIEQGAAMS